VLPCELGDALQTLKGVDKRRLTHREPAQVSRALVRAFERTDRSLMHRVYWAFDMGMGALARVGACALALYVRGKEIYVANGARVRL
jgi:hypothetical protein